MAALGGGRKAGRMCTRPAVPISAVSGVVLWGSSDQGWQAFLSHHLQEVIADSMPRLQPAFVIMLLNLADTFHHRYLLPSLPDHPSCFDTRYLVVSTRPSLFHRSSVIVANQCTYSLRLQFIVLKWALENAFKQGYGQKWIISLWALLLG